MFMNGEPGGQSLKMPVALIDILAAHHLKEGLLLAMLEKTKTGKGKLVEVSLIQAAVSSLVNQASNWLVAGKLPEKQGSFHPNIAPYGDVFKTRDGQEILLAVGTDKQFQNLCRIIKSEELANETLFKTNYSRVQNRNKLNKHIGVKFSESSGNEVMTALHRMNIPAGFIQNLQQVFQMPEVQELILSYGNQKGVRTFVSNDPSNLTLNILPPPHFGEHTEEVLKSLV